MKRLSIGLIATLGLVVLGLAALDKFLETMESADIAGTARDAYLRGSRALDGGETAQAVDALRSAHAMARDNREYEIELIIALMAAGKTSEAQLLMNEILELAPNDGRGNLVAARLANEQGRIRDAESYYHRAIYGEWPANAPGRRIAARMELIGFLREKGSRQELLAELISLEAEAPADNATQRTLARLFLAAGAPARAADIDRALLDQNSGDAAALAGLGEAELEQGRYRDAHTSFTQAFFRNQADASIRSRLQLLNTVMALDPTPRGLPSMEKYRRSVRILDLTRDSLQQCAAKAPQSGADGMVGQISQADAMIANKTPAQTGNETADKALTLAEQMWRTRVTACGGIPESEDPLRLIMEKLMAGS